MALSQEKFTIELSAPDRALLARIAAALDRAYPQVNVPARVDYKRQ